MFEPNSLLYGFVGLAAGVGAHFWSRNNVLKERCAFLTYLDADLSEAFRAVDRALSSRALPESLRRILLLVLHLHADESAGRKFADHLAKSLSSEKRPAASKLTIEMQKLFQTDADLAQDVHRAMASLTFALFFFHHSDHIVVEKVQDETARNPGLLWAIVGKFLSKNGTSRNGMATA